MYDRSVPVAIVHVSPKMEGKGISTLVDSERLNHAFIACYADMVSDLNFKELAPGLVSRDVLSFAEKAEVESEKTSANQNDRFLCIINRKAVANPSLLQRFVEVLQSINQRGGQCLDHIIQRLESDCSGGTSIASGEQAECCASDEVYTLNWRTESILEQTLDVTHVLPHLVSLRVITVTENERIRSEVTIRQERVRMLIDVIRSRGSDAVGIFFTVLQRQRILPPSTLKAGRFLEPTTDPQASSAEVKAFRKSMGKLTTSITDPDQLAVHLFSGDVITKVELDGVINSEHSSVQKTCKLMRLVLDKIERRSEVFCHFTEVLREANMSSSVEILQGNVSKESPLNQAQVLDDSCQVSIPPAAEPYIRHLQEVYRSRPVLEREKSPIMTCKKFINLAAIKKEKVTHSTADDFTKATLQGKIDVIMKSKEPVEMEDIFEVNEGEKLKCVLVQGAPGVGKSTFAWELCCNWELFDKMKRFKIVKLVELRHSYAHEARSIEDLLQVDGTVDGAHSPSEHAIQATAKCITDSDGEGLLLVLDGFDELPHELQTSDDSLYVKLLTNRYLPNCTVVITSRTCAACAIENTCARTHSLSKNVEILGFLPQDIEEYVNNFFPDANMRDKFKTYMESNPLIKSMMYIPLNTAIVTTLYKEKSQIQKRTPMTMTQLYSDLSVHLILCYMTKMNMEYNPRIMIDEGSFSERLKYLPISVVDSVKQLATVAFEGLCTCSQQLIFRGRTIPDEFESMGFMNKAENTMFGITVEPTYNFLHLTVQEFLAAFHISMLPKDEQLKVLKHVSTLPDAEQDHFNVVWRFLAGMTSFQSFGWDTFVKFRFGGVPQINPESDVKMCSSLLLNCLYEAQDETACKQIYPGGYVNYSPMSATMYDYYALGYCISKTPCLWKLCSISGGGLAIIATGIKCSCTARNPHPTGRIELIKLSHEGNKIHDLNKFPECIKENIKELNLSNCGLDNRACNSLATLLHQFRQLESLHLGDNPFTEGGSGRLFRELSKLGSFHQLDLLHSQLGSDDIDGLSTIIRPNGTLTNLVVGNSDMSVDIVESLVNVILQDSCLRTLSIMNIDLVCLAKHLSKELKRNNTLSMLMLWDCSYCIDGCITVARALETNSSLQSLTLMPWYKHQIPSSIFSAMDSSRISWFFYPQNK